MDDNFAQGATGGPSMRKGLSSLIIWQLPAPHIGTRGGQGASAAQALVDVGAADAVVAAALVAQRADMWRP